MASWGTLTNSLPYTVSGGGTLTSKQISRGSSDNFALGSDINSVYSVFSSYSNQGTAFIIIGGYLTDSSEPSGQTGIDPTGLCIGVTGVNRTSFGNISTTVKNTVSVYSFSDDGSPSESYLNGFLDVTHEYSNYKVYAIHNYEAYNQNYAYLTCAPVAMCNDAEHHEPKLFFTGTNSSTFGTWKSINVSNVGYYAITAVKWDNNTRKQSILVQRGKQYTFNIHARGYQGNIGYCGISTNGDIGTLYNSDDFDLCVVSNSSDTDHSSGSYTYKPTQNGAYYLYFEMDYVYGVAGSAGADVKITTSSTQSTITFNRNSGNGGTSTLIATYGITPSSISVPTRSGAPNCPNYTFLGYFDSASGGTKYFNADGTPARIWDKIDASVVLYAHWQNTISWTIRNNGTYTVYCGDDAVARTTANGQRSVTVTSSISCSSGSRVSYGGPYGSPPSGVTFSNGILYIASGTSAFNSTSFGITAISPSYSSAYVGTSVSKTVSLALLATYELSQHYKNSACTTTGDYITTYRTPSVSIGDGMSASGGEAAVTCSVTNSGYWYQKWNNGAVVRHPSSGNFNIIGTAKWCVSSWTANAFSRDSGQLVNGVGYMSSGLKIYHNHMGSTDGTHSVSVRAINWTEYQDIGSSTHLCDPVTQNIVNSHTDSWNNPSISTYTYPNIGAGGGTSTPTVTASQSGTRTWTSGSTQSLTGSLSYSYSMTSGNGFSINTSTGVITAESRGTTPGNARTSNTATVTVSANGRSNTSPSTCLQSANQIIDSNYSPSNYTASVSIGNGLTAAGGSAQVTASASHLAYDYYTSGSYNNQHTVTDSVSWAITNQKFTSSDPENPGTFSISTFSKSGNTLTQTDMGKETGTAYVEITATNEKNSSATATADKSIVNSVSLTINCSTPFTYNTTTPVTVTASYTSGTVEENVQDSLNIDDAGNWIIYSSNKECVEVIDI